MSVNWYNVGNKAEFLAKGIPQEVKTLDLEDLGRVDVRQVCSFERFAAAEHGAHVGDRGNVEALQDCGRK